VAFQTQFNKPADEPSNQNSLLVPGLRRRRAPRRNTISSNSTSQIFKQLAEDIAQGITLARGLKSYLAESNDIALKLTDLKAEAEEIQTNGDKPDPCCERFLEQIEILQERNAFAKECMDCANNCNQSLSSLLICLEQLEATLTPF